jgi:hypothetical protein
MAVGLTALSFIIERKEGLLERSWVAGVTAFEVMLAHVVAQFIVMLVQVKFRYGEKATKFEKKNPTLFSFLKILQNKVVYFFTNFMDGCLKHKIWINLRTFFTLAPISPKIFQKL